MDDSNSNARLSVLETQFLSMSGKLDHILAKVDDLANTTTRMAVLENQITHLSESLGRAFTRVEQAETDLDDQQKFIHRLTGALIFINLAWPIVLGFITYGK